MSYAKNHKQHKDTISKLSLTWWISFLIECFVFSYFRLIRYLFKLNSKTPKRNVIVDFFATGTILYIFWIFKWWYVIGGMIGFLVLVFTVGYLIRRKFNKPLPQPEPEVVPIKVKSVKTVKAETDNSIPNIPDDDLVAWHNYFETHKDQVRAGKS